MSEDQGLDSGLPCRYRGANRVVTAKKEISNNFQFSKLLENIK